MSLLGASHHDIIRGQALLVGSWDHRLLISQKCSNDEDVDISHSYKGNDALNNSDDSNGSPLSIILSQKQHIREHDQIIFLNFVLPCCPPDPPEILWSQPDWEFTAVARFRQQMAVKVHFSFTSISEVWLSCLLLMHHFLCSSTL